MSLSRLSSRALQRCYFLNTITGNGVSAITHVNKKTLVFTAGHARSVSTSELRFANLPQQNPKPDWNRAVSEAEKIVGYPTSFLSLRWLLSDEIANIALHLRRLVGGNHPLMKTAKNLLYNGKNNMQAWGLIVLLVSKAAGHHPDIPEMEQDKSAGVLHSQRALAEVTEMIRTSHLIHKSVKNLQPFQPGSGNSPPVDFADMTFGNKIALLSGDYLLGNSCVELAGLKNQELLLLISAAVRDLTESEFIGDRDTENNPLPSKPATGKEKPPTKVWYLRHEALCIDELMGHAGPEWTARHELSAGTLLGKSCQGALLLAKQPREQQKLAYLFGSHLALAWQACLDIEPFMGPCTGPFSLVSAPVMFAMADRPELYSLIEAGKHDVNDVDYETLHAEVLDGQGIEQSRNLRREHSTAATQVLLNFPDCDARTALHNILLAMQDL